MIPLQFWDSWAVDLIGKIDGGIWTLTRISLFLNQILHLSKFPRFSPPPPSIFSLIDNFWEKHYQDPALLLLCNMGAEYRPYYRSDARECHFPGNNCKILNSSTTLQSKVPIIREKVNMIPVLVVWGTFLVFFWYQ